ncbi:hypothetical protein GCM10025876_08650 [Demequina litorisediminis]|uniref:Sodium/calcium exchanger membrane region domain-containing protein n=1 Tax=Demequina litorisediminis TaxID=1849022 RepID=A0ABQ6IAC0_9MICO|nr:hypothetical protein GCM10025876_08650 [Demequina litorisediminis]
MVGVAGLIQPAAVSADLLHRDMPILMAFTLLLIAFGFRWRRDGRINRLEGAILIALWLAYTVYLVTAGG